MKATILCLSILASLSVTQLRAAEIIPASQPSAAIGNPARDAVTAYRDGRRDLAVELARPLAESDNPEALFLMAFSLESLKEPARLSRGQALDYYYRRAEAAGNKEAGFRRQLILLASGLEQERVEGRKHLEEAAKSGDPAATRILGEAWLRSLLSPKPDPAKAIEQWKAAGAAGDGDALVLLGQLHDGVFGFPDMQDPAAATTHFREAAKLGNQDAYIPLATILLLRGEAPANETEGLAWIEKAHEAADPSAWLVAGDYELKVKKAPPIARESFRKGAEAGQIDCMLRLAALSPDDTPEAAASGRDWLKKAADAGSAEAAAELGHQMLTGNSSEKAAAIRYLEIGASQNSPRAQYELGIAYLEGSGCARDPLAAITWLTEAMKSGDAQSQYKLGTLHEQGIGGPINYANAGVLYTMACNKGHAAAASRIAHMASEGLGTIRKPAEAWAYATLAIERGDESAEPLLTKLDRELDDAGKAVARKTLADLKTTSSNPASAGSKPLAPKQ